MTEFRDIRELIRSSLSTAAVDAWVYEAHAGARPGSVLETSLNEVENADVFLGLFGQHYGRVTVEEYLHARSHHKPALVYIRDRGASRDPALEAFLDTHIYPLHRGVTYAYFDSALTLSQQVATDIMAWLVRRHREITAALAEARVSQKELHRLRSQTRKLKAFTRQPLPSGTTADYLGNQLHDWFTTLQFPVERHYIQANDHVEMIVNVPSRKHYDRVLVRCVSGEAGLAHVADLTSAADEHDIHEAWLVAQQRVSPAARRRANGYTGCDVSCYTLDELLEVHADLSSYLDWLEQEIRRKGVDTVYVPLACRKVETDPKTKRPIGVSQYDQTSGWTEGYIDRWLDDPSKEHISILGEFGTGKTWFTMRYAWQALTRYRDAKTRGIARPRIPLVIPLRDYARAVSVESLFSEFFFRTHEIPLPGYSVFEQLNRMGKLLLIFDGFDEMASRIDRQKMIDNYWELARVVVPGSKVVLTSRTEHFPSAQEGRALLRAELQAATANLTGEPPQFEVLELERLNDDQIRTLLSFRAGPELIEQIMRNHDLRDLARRPVMIDIILEAYPDIRSGKPIDLSRVYLYAVTRKMQRDIRAERTFTSFADKLLFLCELSWEMLSTHQMSLNYRAFPDRLRRLFGDAVRTQKDLDHWQYDMMAQTMLIRNEDGDYSPAHRSLLEFFSGYKLAAELGALADDFCSILRNVLGGKGKDMTWSEYFRLPGQSQGKNSESLNLRSFLPEPFERLRETAGLQALTPAVASLMKGMVVPSVLREVIASTRLQKYDAIRYTGGNAITLLVLAGDTLDGMDLSHAVLAGAQLEGISLAQHNLEATSLRESTLALVDFSDAAMKDVDLSAAVVTDCHIQRADLQRCNLGQSRISGSTLAGANLSHALLSGSLLNNSDLSHARCRSANFREAQVTSCNLEGADLVGTDFRGGSIHRCPSRSTRFDRIQWDVQQILVIIGDWAETLPLGATLLDAAFCLHNEVGLHCTGGHIDGRESGIGTKLKHGCTVWIEVDRSSYHAEPGWLGIVVTTKARDRITGFLNKCQDDCLSAVSSCLSSLANQDERDVLRQHDLTEILLQRALGEEGTIHDICLRVRNRRVDVNVIGADTYESLKRYVRLLDALVVAGVVRNRVRTMAKLCNLLESREAHTCLGLADGRKLVLEVVDGRLKATAVAAACVRRGGL